MRGLLPGLATPHPIASTLPGVYQADDFVQRFCDGLDAVLAPVLLTLDSLPAYLDPRTAPPDVLDWLAGWVGIVLDQHDEPQRRRFLVRSAVTIHRLRGTAEGIRRAVEAVFGVIPDVVETGAAEWSPHPAATLPGSAPAGVFVRLRVRDPSDVDPERLHAVVGAVVPAHVPHRVEVAPLPAG
jgi:phage tail-like protein